MDSDLTGLSDGKHSLLIEGHDVEGHVAYDLLVPFGVGLTLPLFGKTL